MRGIMCFSHALACGEASLFTGDVRAQVYEPAVAIVCVKHGTRFLCL